MLLCVRRGRRRGIDDGRQRKAVPVPGTRQRQYDVDDDDAQLERVVDDAQPVAVQSEEAAGDQRQRAGHTEPRVQWHVAHAVPEREREESSHTDPEHGRVTYFFAVTRGEMGFFIAAGAPFL